ncbi:hypothetical protein AVEN_122488-1 [Araneus ventricosus]|uniref:Uncharacterized protein n=1 Tax=Araneus ventricosus TaxID=182803 RepID=A0A4Y2RRA7_ARAVE|nr:hypothetical protein AVEN_122488-1 [Araneus ventricosus]
MDKYPAFPQRFPDLAPCDFWLYGHLNSTGYKGRAENLVTWKDCKGLQVRRINAELLCSVVEHKIQRMHLFEENKPVNMPLHPRD